MKQQRPRIQIPPSIAEQTLIRLMRIGDRLWRASDERFHRWGLTDNHYNVLRILNGTRTPLSQTDIGRQMLSTRANVTKLVDALEAKGLVARKSCGDRRVKEVVLTPAGATFLQETLTEVLAFVNELMTPLTRTEQKELFRLLKKFSE